METRLCQVRTALQFRPSIPKIGYFNPAIVSSNVENQQICPKERILRCGQVSKLKCCKGNSVPELQNERNREEEEWIGIKKMNGKCKETVGMVELMECLEREAIMGEDEGRDPTDYNRRAQIFDKSSKIFQALKETTTSSVD